MTDRRGLVQHTATVVRRRRHGIRGVHPQLSATHALQLWTRRHVLKGASAANRAGQLAPALTGGGLRSVTRRAGAAPVPGRSVPNAQR